MELVSYKGHKLYMDNYFSSPRLFDDLHNRRIGFCGTVRHNRKEMDGKAPCKEIQGRQIWRSSRPGPVVSTSDPPIWKSFTQVPPNNVCIMTRCPILLKDDSVQNVI
jgi:hypothetical protein